MSATLSRRITLGLLVLFGVGDILGAGIYGLVGKAAGEMGNAVWLAFLTSMVAAGLTGLSYASIGSRYPKAGGAAYVTHRAFGKPFLSYVVGLAVAASGLTSMAAASRAFSGYFTGLVPLPQPVVVALFCVAIALVVIRGIREALWMNAICTIIELGGLVFILAVGARYIGAVDYLDAVTPANPTGSITPALMLSGAVLTFYSFIGFEDILNVSEEVVQPERNLPLGLLLAVGISSVVYMGISVVAVSVVPAGELAASKQPLVDVVRRAAPWMPAGLYGFIAMFAVANTALLNFVMGSRLMYGMARQGLLPSALGRVHSTRRTPHVAALAILGVLLVLALSGDISTLAKATSVLLLVCFATVNVSLIVLQRRPGEARGRFEVPALVPALGTLICLAMLSFAKSQELFVAGIMVAAIVGLYLVQRPSARAVEHLET